MVETGSALAADAVAIPARSDTRSRRRRMVAPVAALVGTVAGLAYLAAVDPNEPGHYPLCPTQAIFGVDCPGCGVMRGMHDLVTGDVRGALDHNLLLVVMVPLVIVLWVRWVRRAWRGETEAVTRAQLQRRNSLLLLSLVAILVFGVVRNFVPFLGSGIG
jgi:hypothetical protein